MTIHAELVLADDVVMMPAEQIATGGTQLAFAPGDHVVGRPGARVPAKLVDARAASLLQQFRSPRRIVDAIVLHSSTNGHEAQRTLEEALPLIQHFVAAGFLVPRDSESAQRITFSLELGERIGGFEIVQRIQALEDTEVYRARSGERDVAVKVGRGAAGGRAIANERHVLERLDGTVDPGLVTAGEEKGRPFVALRWCDGVSSAVAAIRLRDHDGARAAASLAVRVLEAYERLHAQDVVHGDVHPDNLVVSPAGRVTILDFGLARNTADPAAHYTPRGGVGGFTDPAYAAARRDGREPPPVDAAAEQYALGALVYLLITGFPYVELSILEEGMVRQVLKDAPIPFADRALEWPAVEHAVMTALKKDPSERHEDVAAFARALRDAVATRPRDRSRSPRRPERFDDVLARVRRPDAAERAFANGLWECSVNTGAAGVAYALYRMALRREDPELIAAAEVWARWADRNAAAATERDDLADDLPPGVRLDASLFHRDPGIHCVLALVAHARGDWATYDDACARFLDSIEVDVDDVDLTLGRAGALLGCTHLLTVADVDSEAGRRLAEAGERQRAAIWTGAAGGEPVAGGRIGYLGMAHGWGGILYATLCWHAAAGTTVAPGVADRLDELADLAEPAGKAAAVWPRLAPPRSSDYWTGWCNGAAGLAHLWEIAGTLLQRDDYFDLAERAATAGSETGAGGDLCCGSAGSAYAVLRVYRRTRDEHLLTIARRLAEHASTTVGDDRAYALYKGRLGVALLHEELADPATARMPLFEPDVGRRDAPA